MNKNLILYVPVVALAIALLSAGIANAQIGEPINRDRLRMDLEQTEQLIEHAKDAVRASGSIIARTALEQAVQLQVKARMAFRLGTTEGSFMAAKLTRHARELAKNALSLARTTQENEHAALRRLEHASESLRRAHDAVGMLTNHPFESVLTSARENLRRAWEFYRERQFRPAVKLAAQVESVARKILETASRQTNLRHSFERRLENTLEQIDRISALLPECQSPVAEALLEKARDQATRAKELADRRRLEPAHQALQRAHKMLARARSECASTTGLKERAEQIRHQADRLRDRVDSGDDVGYQLLKNIATQLDLAREHLSANRPEAAIAALKAAQLTIRQLRQHLENGVF